MRLKPTFPHGPLYRLSFYHPEQYNIALEFAYRLAAYSDYVKLMMNISSGQRSIEYQKKLYEDNCKQYPPNGNGYVSRPGNSWHNYNCAVDIAGDTWKKYILKGDMNKTVKKQEMYKFGLCLPLNYVDSKSVFEWWHVQPVETLDWAGKDKSKFLEGDDLIWKDDGIMTDREFQAATGLYPDGIVGTKTLTKIQEVLDCIIRMLKAKNHKSAKLTIDGKSVDAMMFAVDGTNYVPIRTVAEALGAKVDWDGKTQTVIIRSK